MKTLTIDDVMALGPCDRYPRELVSKLFGRRKRATPKLIAAAKIPPGDRLWLLLRGPWLDDRQRRLLAADIAEHVLPIWEAKYPDDKRPRMTIEFARRYARGEATEEERDAAWDAAWAAAWAAGAAAGDAAGAARAAGDAAWAAAWAAGAAAGDAAWAAGAAAWDAAWAAGAEEWRWILARAVKYAEGRGTGLIVKPREGQGHSNSVVPGTNG
jgi:hypothetical protein